MYITARIKIAILTVIVILLLGLVFAYHTFSQKTIAYIDLSEEEQTIGFQITDIETDDIDTSVEEDSYILLGGEHQAEFTLSLDSEVLTPAPNDVVIAVNYLDEGASSSLYIQYHKSDGDIVRSEIINTGLGDGLRSYNFWLTDIDFINHDDDWDVQLVAGENEISIGSIEMLTTPITIRNTAKATITDGVTNVDGMGISFFDSNFQPVNIDKTENDLFVINPNEGIFSMGFDISPAYISAQHGNVEVVIEYLDEGEGSFNLLYNSSMQKVSLSTNQPANIFETGDYVNTRVSFIADNAYPSEEVQLTDTGEWLTKKITLSQAAFSDKLSQNDFALLYDFPQDPKASPKPLTIRSISATGSGSGSNQSTAENISINYSIVNLYDETILQSVDTTINLNGDKEQYFDTGITVTQNGCFEFRLNVIEWEDITAMPFSVMPMYNTDNTLNDIFGVCTHYGLPWFSGDVTLKASVADLMGAGYIRDEMRWELAETEKGIVEILPEWDYFVNEAIARGLKPMIILAYGNPLYDEGGSPYSEEGLAAFAEYVTTVVSHFDGRVEAFEIWNEHNLIGSAFNITSRPPEDYVKMLKVAYEAIKTVNPNTTVVAGSISGADIVWIEEILNFGAGSYMDVLSYHPYTQPRSPEHGGFAYAAPIITQILARYNVSVPLWVSEVGWPTSTDYTGVSEIDSANYLVRAYILGLATGIDKIFWYDLINDGVDATEPEYNFGLVRNWNDPQMPLAAKFNYLAYNTVSGMLADAEYVSFTGLSDNVFAGIFSPIHSDTTMLVLWTLEGESELILNVTSSNNTVTDIFSNSRQLENIDGSVTVNITTSPIFLECSLGSDPIISLIE